MAYSQTIGANATSPLRWQWMFTPTAPSLPQLNMKTPRPEMITMMT